MLMPSIGVLAQNGHDEVSIEKSHHEGPPGSELLLPCT